VIFADTNVVSETAKLEPDRMVARWIRQHDAELCLSSVVIGEIAFGIARVRPDERSIRLSGFMGETLRRFAGRIYSFDRDAALIYGEVMGETMRRGRGLSDTDGMIAAIALRHGASLATRNIAHFTQIGLVIVNPWER
jgi:predicted nucleic acid-binding protein